MPFPAFVCATRVSQCCKNCPTPVLKECTLTCLRNALIFEFYEIQTQTGVCAARSVSWSSHADDRNGLKENKFRSFFLFFFKSICALMGRLGQTRRHSVCVIMTHRQQRSHCTANLQTFQILNIKQHTKLHRENVCVSPVVLKWFKSLKRLFSQPKKKCNLWNMQNSAL